MPGPSGSIKTRSVKLAGEGSGGSASDNEFREIIINDKLHIQRWDGSAWQTLMVSEPNI